MQKEEKKVEKEETKAYIVQGYLFADEAEADLARSEIKKIKYIEERMNYNNVKMIFNFYNNCIENKIFVTPIGYAYMEKTKEFILANGYSEEVLPIPIASNNHTMKREMKKILQREEQLKKDKERIVGRARITFMLNIVLFILVILMFLIASTSDKPNIINYEKVIQNEYATWAEELSERENIVREKELQLSIINEN
jgi:hypothetical protein